MLQKVLESMNYTSENIKKLSKDQRGQTFLEFMLLLFMVMFMSYGMLITSHEAIAKRWETIDKIVSSPTDSKIQVR